jgi:predicted N-acyltransferase
MPDDGTSITIRVIDSLAQIPAAEWDACAMASGNAGNPFVSHAFLHALEASRSVGSRTGWLPQHLVVEAADGQILGAVPAYVKSHSQGEYVFDHAWARAYENAGGRYYPKLQAAVPFTPVPGPRLLLRPGPLAESVADALAGALVEVCRRGRLSSVHVTFCTDQERQRFAAHGFLHRLGIQYHWHNRGYGSFDDFLAALSSRKRKAIRKERASVQRDGLVIEALNGADIKARHWDSFFQFYIDTGGRKWGSPYLTRAFFDILGATMADRVVLIMASADGRPVGGALNLHGDDALFGRNWGCVANYNYLHFEACYYQAIDYAIRHGLARVEAGAQGEHKIQRGYLPVETHSMHWIADPGLREPIDRYLVQERAAMEEECRALMPFSPYRKDGEG